MTSTLVRRTYGCDVRRLVRADQIQMRRKTTLIGRNGHMACNIHPRTRLVDLMPLQSMFYSSSHPTKDEKPDKEHSISQQKEPDQQTSSNTVVQSSSTSTSPSVTTNSSLVKAYFDLSKARLSTLVVATTAAGFISAGGGTSLETMAYVSVGTALCSCSAAAWNQIFELDRDSKMKRTQQRPLVSGILSTSQATWAASLWGTMGTALLIHGTDPYTTSLAVGNILLYSGVYTYLKPRTIYNTWVGALVGAIPPVIGWSAATGGQIFDLECCLLGATLYLWQMPHFFALSFMHRVDYARGGFHMVPVMEEHHHQQQHFGTSTPPTAVVRYDETAKLITRYTWYLGTIPILSTLSGVTSAMFGIEGFLLNGYALKVAYDFDRNRTNAKARQVFLTSLWYLPCWLMLFMIHSKTWDDKKTTEDNIIRKTLDQYLGILRNVGRKLCVHEQVILDQRISNISTHGDGSGSVAIKDSAKACPIVVVKHKTEEAAAITVDSIHKVDV